MIFLFFLLFLPFLFLFLLSERTSGVSLVIFFIKLWQWVFQNIRLDIENQPFEESATLWFCKMFKGCSTQNMKLLKCPNIFSLTDLHKGAECGQQWKYPEKYYDGSKSHIFPFFFLPDFLWYLAMLSWIHGVNSVLPGLPGDLGCDPLQWSVHLPAKAKAKLLNLELKLKLQNTQTTDIEN